MMSLTCVLDLLGNENSARKAEIPYNTGGVAHQMEGLKTREKISALSHNAVWN